MGYELTVFLLLAFYLFGISVQDVRRHEISNFAPVMVIMASPFISAIPLAERILGLLAVFIPLLIVNLLTNGFGMGDVKLCAAFGFVLGAFAEYLALAAALVVAIIVGKSAKINPLPLAPFLCGAGMAAIIIKEVIPLC